MDINKKVSVIKQEILEEAKQKKEKMIQTEKRSRKQKYQQFKEDLKKEQEQILNSYRQKAQTQEESIRAKVNLKRRRLKREKKHEFLQQVLDDLLVRLKEYRQADAYSGFLEKMIKKAAKTLDPGQIHLKLNKDDFNIYCSEIEKELAQQLPDYNICLKDEKADIVGGVVVASADGKEIVEYSFQTCLEQVKEDIARELKRKV